MSKNPVEALYFKIEIRDKKGNLLRTSKLKRCHSFVLQYLQIEEIGMAKAYGADPDTVSIKDTSNTAQTMKWTNKAVEAGSGLTTYGILAGIGETAPANTDYAMQTLIAHGTGAGQMQYSSCSVGSASVVGSNVDMTIVRSLTNNSGGTITIKEIGIVISAQDSTTTQRYFLIVRDAVSQAVLNDEVASILFIRRTTV